MELDVWKSKSSLNMKLNSIPFTRPKPAATTATMNVKSDRRQALAMISVALIVAPAGDAMAAATSSGSGDWSSPGLSKELDPSIPKFIKVACNGVL